MSGKPMRKDRSFEEAMERLEAIVTEIESDELGLERQFQLFKEGMTLARFCEAKLKEVQKSVEIVLKESGEEWKTVPFEPDRTSVGSEGSDDDDRD